MKSIINILENASGVTTLLTNGADSIFIDIEPQEEVAPYIVIMSEIVDPNSTFSGENLDEYLVTVYSVAAQKYTGNSVVGAWDISEQVRSALVGQTGSFGGENYNVTQHLNRSTFVNADTNVQRIEVEQEFQVFSRR